MKPLLACTPGDPAGIGPEVVLRAAAAATDSALVLLGDPQHWESIAGSMALAQIDDIDAARAHANAGEAGPWTLPCATVKPGLELGHPRPSDAKMALDSVATGADLAAAGKVDGLVTAPLNKNMIAAFEPRFMGHTEYLAARAGVQHPTMLFAGPKPHIALLTTHLPLSTALTLIRRDLVAAALSRLHHQWADAFGHAPTIGVAAINPHAGEAGRLGTEESRELYPALAQARADDIDARGPYPADSIFLHKDLDVVLALYHDQGTIMAKRAPWPTVNVTLGLPYIRTSPDHGTAYDRAGKGTADHRPMAAAIEVAAELARRQIRTTEKSEEDPSPPGPAGATENSEEDPCPPRPACTSETD